MEGRAMSIPVYVLSLVAVAVAGCQLRVEPGQAAADAALSDGPVAADAAPGGDGATGDGAVAARCPGPDSDVVALFSFDDGAGPTFADETGAHQAEVVSGSVSIVAGPDGCGNAVAFPAAGEEAVIVVPDSPAFQLAAGSVDLWVRAGSVAGRQGLASRDADGASLPGHFKIDLEEGYVVVRLQQDNASYFLCSDAPLLAGSWVHIGVNFGPPGAELWVDGVRATRDEPVEQIPCGDLLTTGIDGNQNPWSLGAANSRSAEGLSA
jgi:hypothetical protein